MLYRLYEWGGTRDAWRHADRADDGLRRLARAWHKILQDDLAFAKAVIVPARSWVTRVTQGMPVAVVI
eukprot:6114499-Lingulodinium_polyedra.AAC.1